MISAGAGLVSWRRTRSPPTTRRSPGCPDALRTHADQLGIAAACGASSATPCALTLLLAGNDYFDAARLDEAVEWGSPTVALVSPSRAADALAHPQLRTSRSVRRTPTMVAPTNAPQGGDCAADAL